MTTFRKEDLGENLTFLFLSKNIPFFVNAQMQIPYKNVYMSIEIQNLFLSVMNFLVVLLITSSVAICSVSFKKEFYS